MVRMCDYEVPWFHGSLGTILRKPPTLDSDGNMATNAGECPTFKEQSFGFDYTNCAEGGAPMTITMVLSDKQHSVRGKTHCHCRSARYRESANSGAPTLPSPYRKLVYRFYEHLLVDFRRTLPQMTPSQVISYPTCQTPTKCKLSNYSLPVLSRRGPNFAAKARQATTKFPFHLPRTSRVLQTGIDVHPRRFIHTTCLHYNQRKTCHKSSPFMQFPSSLRLRSR